MPSSSTAPFENHMDGIIHLTDGGRVNWLVRCWNKYVFLFSVDFRASQISGEEKDSCSFYLGTLVSEKILVGISQTIFLEMIFLE